VKSTAKSHNGFYWVSLTYKCDSSIEDVYQKMISILAKLTAASNSLRNRTMASIRFLLTHKLDSPFEAFSQMMSSKVTQNSHPSIKVQ
jgi:hypothetical protein